MARSLLGQLGRLTRSALEKSMLADELGSMSRSCGMITAQGTFRSYQVGVLRGKKDDQSSVSHGSEPTSSSNLSSKHLPIKSRQSLNRLMYHAKQRGWLELDIIIGEWAEQNLESLSEEELHDFQSLLGTENPNLFKFITGQMEEDGALSSNKAFQMIKKEVLDRMKFSGAFRTSKAAQGAEWVRGWNDENKRSTID